MLSFLAMSAKVVGVKEPPSQPIVGADPAGAPQAATTDPRKRIEAIETSGEANGREGLARHLARKTDMAADAAISALKASPRATGDRSILASALKKGGC